MYPSYGNPRVNKRCFILNSNINLACHIFKDVATRRTKIETGWQVSCFDSKSLNTNNFRIITAQKMKFSVKDLSSSS